MSPESSAVSLDNALPTMESDMSGMVFIPSLTEQKGLNPQPRKSRFIEHLDLDDIPEEQESSSPSSTPTTKPTSWLRSKCGKILPKKHLAPIDEASKTFAGTKNRQDNSQPKSGKSFSDRISTAKTKIRQIANPLTRRQQPQATEAPRTLGRTQMEAALKNPVIQNANTDTGEATTTTEAIGETVPTPGSQSPPRSSAPAEHSEMAESLPVSVSPAMDVMLRCNRYPLNVPVTEIPPMTIKGTPGPEMLERLREFKANFVS